MKPEDLMRGSPVPPEAQVTLANWRTAPYSRWAFRNVRQLIPTAPIKASAHPSKLESSPRALVELAFEMPAGGSTTVGDTLADTFADALVVMHRGTVVSEWYARGMQPDTRHVMFSVSKSVCGTLGGALIDAGKLDPSLPVIHYVPDMRGSVYAECSVRQVMDMTVALNFNEDYEDPDGDVIRYRRSSGWEAPRNGVQPEGGMRAFLAGVQPSGKPHGVLFDYVSTNTDVISLVYEAAAGMPYAEILSKYLWEPMGAEHDAHITVDSLGAARAAGGICATARDMCRFGEMIRRRGIANGQQVVPGWWVDDIRYEGDPAAFANGSMSTVFPGASYRSQWYSLDAKNGVLGAAGVHGQWVWVDMAREVVIVKTASQPKPMDLDAMDYRWLAAFNALAAHLSNA